MTELKQIYKCNVCGNIVEILHKGVGELVCCNKPMNLFEEKTEDEGKEKHIPVIEKTDNETIVKVGSIPHPMEEDHYIEWIELITDNGSYKKFLKPGDLPEIKFDIKSDNVKARAFCNIHGLWKS